MTTQQFKHGTRAWLAAAGACITALSAQATEPVAGQNGLMVFPHARVSTLAASGLAQPAPAQTGMKAFKDPVSGQLVQPTAEQVAELDAAAAAAAAAAAQAARLASPTHRTVMKSNAATTFHPPQGGIGIVVDDTQMSYAVAHKDAHGAIVEECLPDAAAAQRALHGGTIPPTAVKGELK